MFSLNPDTLSYFNNLLLSHGLCTQCLLSLKYFFQPLPCTHSLPFYLVNSFSYIYSSLHVTSLGMPCLIHNSISFVLDFIKIFSLKFIELIHIHYYTLNCMYNYLTILFNTIVSSVSNLTTSTFKNSKYLTNE